MAAFPSGLSFMTVVLFIRCHKIHTIVYSQERLQRVLFKPPAPRLMLGGRGVSRTRVGIGAVVPRVLAVSVPEWEQLFGTMEGSSSSCTSQPPTALFIGDASPALCCFLPALSEALRKPKGSPLSELHSQSCSEVSRRQQVACRHSQAVFWNCSCFPTFPPSHKALVINVCFKAGALGSSIARCIFLLIGLMSQKGVGVWLKGVPLVVTG